MCPARPLKSTTRPPLTSSRVRAELTGFARFPIAPMPGPKSRRKKADGEREPMETLTALKQRYANRGNAPLSLREIGALYGYKWISAPDVFAGFKQHFAVCRDGIVRTR